MRKRKTKKKKGRMLKYGLIVLVISIVLLLTQSIKSGWFFRNLLYPSANEKSTQQKNSEKKEENPSFWSSYINKEYSISFSYPYLLNRKEFEETGEYVFFVVFEENKFSVEKGVAFGVSSDGLEKEVERIKSNVLKQGDSKLIKDEEYEFSCLKSWVLEYESEDESMEARSFFIFEKGDYTFSFSTVPEQIQRLINSIEFTN